LVGEGISPRLPEHYVLFLSTVQPRKNVARLIDAFGIAKRLHPELPHRLVIAGKMGWRSGRIAEKIAEQADRVLYVGPVSDAERWTLYAHADLFVLPSLAEGFGLGVLEAFQCGVPVAVSDAWSLPEIAGDAALYFDPLVEDDIARAIVRGLTDPCVRRELRERGFRRLSHFSWERCAQQTLHVLTSAGSSG
jgi:glycosyltransferase involved in cell wall biosynthesis